MLLFRSSGWATERRKSLAKLARKSASALEYFQKPPFHGIPKQFSVANVTQRVTLHADSACLGSEIRRRTILVQLGKDHAIKTWTLQVPVHALLGQTWQKIVSFLVHQTGLRHNHWGPLSICIAYASCMYARAAHLIRQVPMNRSEWIVDVEISLSVQNRWTFWCLVKFVGLSALGPPRIVKGNWGSRSPKAGSAANRNLRRRVSAMPSSFHELLR